MKTYFTADRYGIFVQRWLTERSTQLSINNECLWQEESCFVNVMVQSVWALYYRVVNDFIVHSAKLLLQALYTRESMVLVHEQLYVNCMCNYER